MRPTTRSYSRRLQAARITRLRVRKMDDTMPSQLHRDFPYNTRSSPVKKHTAGKEKARGSWKWCDQKKSLFLQLCVEEIRNGKRAGSTLKPEAYKHVAAQIGLTFQEECIVAQCKNFWQQMKTLWSASISLHSATGLGVDPVSAAIVADDQWWEDAALVKPDIAKLKGKSVEEIIHYGDILFKQVTATGEHVIYPSTAVGPNNLVGLTRRLDLNFGPSPEGGMGSCIPFGGGALLSNSLQLTLGTLSSSGSKRKSYEVGQSNRRGKKKMVCSPTIDDEDNACNANEEKEKEREKEKEKEIAIPTMDMCWPHLIEVFSKNKQLSTYGATMLGNNERQREIFLGWPTLEQKVE